MEEAASSEDGAALAWVAEVAHDHLVLWTRTDELKLGFPTGIDFVRGMVLVLKEGAGGPASLSLCSADHIEADEIQHFMRTLFGADKPEQEEEPTLPEAEEPEPEPEASPPRPTPVFVVDASTQTPPDGPSPLFTDELLRCAADPKRMTTNAHLMQTVQRLSVLRKARQEQPPPAYPDHDQEEERPQREHADAAWEACHRAAQASLSAGGKKRSRSPAF